MDGKRLKRSILKQNQKKTNLNKMKTREDIIFEQVGLEGTLKHIGCYDAVLKAMADFAKQEQIKSITAVYEDELCDHNEEEVFKQGDGFVCETYTCGENKNKFEAWLYGYYILQYGKAEDLEGFNQMNNWVKTFSINPFEMQMGVLLFYYDDCGYMINVTQTALNDFYFTVSKAEEINHLVLEYGFKSRNEAYQEAFKKANEIINNKLK